MRCQWCDDNALYMIVRSPLYSVYEPACILHVWLYAAETDEVHTVGGLVVS